MTATIETAAETAAPALAEAAPLHGVRAGDLVRLGVDGMRDAYLVPVIHAGPERVRVRMDGRGLPLVAALLRTADGREDCHEGRAFRAGARPATPEDLGWAAAAGFAVTGGPLPPDLSVPSVPA